MSLLSPIDVVNPPPSESNFMLCSPLQEILQSPLPLQEILQSPLLGPISSRALNPLSNRCGQSNPLQGLASCFIPSSIDVRSHNPPLRGQRPRKHSFLSPINGVDPTPFEAQRPTSFPSPEISQSTPPSPASSQILIRLSNQCSQSSPFRDQYPR